MADASNLTGLTTIRQITATVVAVGELRQLPGGAAGWYTGRAAANVGDATDWRTSGQLIVAKKAGVVILDGGRVYWDAANAQATYARGANSRDFYLGRAVGDAASADTTLTVNLNANPAPDIDLARDAFLCVPAGTQALGGFLPAQRFGGATKLKLSSTNEAQKVDALSRDGFAVGAKAIIEMGVTVVSVGSGAAPDLSVGIASGTHATDASSITQRLFVHADGNASKVNVESADGTHTTAITDTTQTFTAGSRFEVWFDTRVPSAVKVYVNGAQALGGTTFDVSAGSAAWFLLAHLEKTAAADTFEADIDWLRARFTKQ